MKKYISILLLVGAVLVSSPCAAMIADLPSDFTTGFFKDMRTGYVWWDFDNTHRMYYDFNIGLENAEGFHIATKEEIQTLEFSLNNVITTDPLLFFHGPEGFLESNGGQIASFYNDGDHDDGISWVIGSVDGGQWYYGAVYELPNKDSVSPEEYAQAVDMQRKFSMEGVGMMIVDTRQAIVPEPGTAFLMTIGFGMLPWGLRIIQRLSIAAR